LDSGAKFSLISPKLAEEVRTRGSFRKIPLQLAPSDYVSSPILVEGEDVTDNFLTSYGTEGFFAPATIGGVEIMLALHIIPEKDPEAITHGGDLSSVVNNGRFMVLSLPDLLNKGIGLTLHDRGVSFHG
jgi:hypothetical protein